MEEVWRAVVGAEGYYEVSSHGRVRRVKATHLNRNHGGLLKPWNQEGYRAVELCKDGANIIRKVHQLVMTSFVGPYPSGMEINHKDGDKANNRIENLEYVTHQRNNEHARQELGKVMAARGEANNHAILTEDQVRVIRQRARSGESYTTIGRDFGLKKRAVGQCVQHLTWSHIGPETRHEDILYARSRISRGAKGSAHRLARLDEEKVRDARIRFSRGERIADIADHFRVRWATIQACVLGKTWKHVV